MIYFTFINISDQNIDKSGLGFECCFLSHLKQEINSSLKADAKSYPYGNVILNFAISTNLHDEEKPS